MQNWSVDWQILAKVCALSLFVCCSMQIGNSAKAQIISTAQKARCVAYGQVSHHAEVGATSQPATSSSPEVAWCLKALTSHDDDEIAKTVRDLENARHRLYKEIQHEDDAAQRATLAEIYRDQQILQPVLTENNKVNEEAFRAGYAKYFAPYINQYDPPGWEPHYIGNMCCGKTTMAMVCRAFGKGERFSDEELILHNGDLVGSPDGGRTRLRGWYTWARDYGLKAKIRGPGADTDWIVKQLARKRLVACLGAFYGMPLHLDLKKIAETSTGHYILVTGITPEGNFLVNDPADPRAKLLTPAELAGFINNHDLIPSSGIGAYAKGYQISLWVDD